MDIITTSPALLTGLPVRPSEARQRSGERGRMTTIGDSNSRRDVPALAVPQVGSVTATGDPAAPFAVLDASGRPVEPVPQFLLELTACDYSPATCRSTRWRCCAGCGSSPR